MSQQAQKYKAKEFRVAVEGGTTDGRTIQRNWISEMAETYNREVYGARAWMEHMRGLYPDSTFGAHGDVLSVRAAEVTEGEFKGRLALYATIQPLESMVAITTKAKQKIYTSIEVDPNFAKTGKAYLTGLGFTDSPASLGTSVLEFAAKNPAANPFAARKFNADSVITAALEQEMSFEPEASGTEAGGKFAAMFSGLLDKLRGKSADHDQQFTQVLQGLEVVGDRFKQQDADIAEALRLAKEAKEASGKTSTEFTELKQQLDTTDAKQHSQRPRATGGSGQQQTDC